MTNFIRRRYYSRSAPPPLDEANIDGVMSMDFGVPHILPPHLIASDLYQVIVNDLTDAADGGTGFYNAIGEGDPDWDETPVPPAGETALEALLGIMGAFWQYVDPDVAGAIIFSDGSRWTVSVTITKYLYLEAPYAATVESDKAIRELALYLNATPAAGHESDPYIAAADIDDLGDFLALARIPIVNRSALTSGKVRIVLRVGHA